jgi:ATP-binding cassette subfamily C protein
MPDGRRRPVDREVAGPIEPGAWLFSRPLPDRRLGLIDLVRYCRGLTGLARDFVLVLATAFAGALLGLTIPIASGILVDRVIPEADLRALNGAGPSRLGVMCGFLATIAVATAAFQAIQSLMVLRIEGRVSAT